MHFGKFSDVLWTGHDDTVKHILNMNIVCPCADTLIQSHQLFKEVVDFLQTRRDVFATCWKTLPLYLTTNSRLRLKIDYCFAARCAECGQTLLSPGYLSLSLWWRPLSQWSAGWETICLCPSSLQTISVRFNLVIMVKTAIFLPEEYMRPYTSLSRLRKTGSAFIAKNSWKKYDLALATSHPKENSSCLNAGWPNLSNLPSASLIFSLQVKDEQIAKAAPVDILPGLNSF